MYDTTVPGASPGVEEPSWKDDSRGTRSRVALWLLQEVGVGSVFTKSMLRGAFPGIEQVDRRMRDLRASGWRIDTAKQDPALHLDELRFVEQGEPVWGPNQPKERTISARSRKAVLARDSYCCVTCGIAAGEPYAEDPLRKAQLAVSHQGEGHDDDSYTTLCDMCRRSDAAPSWGAALAALEDLSIEERRTLATWLSMGRRQRGQLEMAWSVTSRLSPADQAKIIAKLDTTEHVKGSM